MGGSLGRLGLALVLVVAAACGGDSRNDDARPSATVPPEPPTTVPADPYAIPPVIDAAYLNSVFEALDRVDGDVSRLIVANNAFVPDAAIRLRAIYSEDEFRRQQEQWLGSLRRGLDRFRRPPGNRRSTTERVISARSDCVFAAVSIDLSPVTTNEPAVATEYIAIRPVEAPAQSKQHNPTPWMITAEGFNEDRSQPPDPCASS